MNFVGARNFGLEQHRKYLDKRQPDGLDTDQIELGKYHLIQNSNQKILIKMKIILLDQIIITKKLFVNFLFSTGL